MKRASACSHRKCHWLGPFSSGRGSREYAWCCNCGALGYRYGLGRMVEWWKPGYPGNRGDWLGADRVKPQYIYRLSAPARKERKR